MTTTTHFGAIRDAYIPLIEALTPTTQQRYLFRRLKRYGLREWAERNSTEAALRKFQILRGDGIEPPMLDPSAYTRQETLRLLVAYPVIPGLYTKNEDVFEAMDDLVRADARQLRDLIFSSGNYQPGQSAALPEGTSLPEPERGENIWFQELRFDLIYTEAQTLT